MAFTCWTLDGTYTGESVRQSLAFLAGYAPSGRPLGASSGVRAGTPTTTVSITGSGPYSAVVGPHAGVLDVETSGTAAPYGYANNSNFTQALNAADATNPRIDLISVQLTDTNEGDTGTSAVAPVYTVGTPAATPGVPAAPARSMVLAQVTVPKATTGAPTVNWVAPTFTSEPLAWSSRVQIQGTNYATGAGTTGFGQLIASWTPDQGGANIAYGAGAWTFSIPGLYAVEGHLGWANNASGSRSSVLTLNGNLVDQQWADPVIGHVCTVPFGHGALVINAGDTVSVYGYQSSGANLTLTTNPGFNRITINRIRSL